MPDDRIFQLFGAKAPTTESEDPAQAFPLTQEERKRALDRAKRLNLDLAPAQPEQPAFGHDPQKAIDLDRELNPRIPELPFSKGQVLRRRTPIRDLPLVTTYAEAREQVRGLGIEAPETPILADNIANLATAWALKWTRDRGLILKPEEFQQIRSSYLTGLTVAYSPIAEDERSDVFGRMGELLFGEIERQSIVALEGDRTSNIKLDPKEKERHTRIASQSRGFAWRSRNERSFQRALAGELRRSLQVSALFKRGSVEPEIREMELQLFRDLAKRAELPEKETATFLGDRIDFMPARHSLGRFFADVLDSPARTGNVRETVEAASQAALIGHRMEVLGIDPKVSREVGLANLPGFLAPRLVERLADRKLSRAASEGAVEGALVERAIENFNKRPSTWKVIKRAIGLPSDPQPALVFPEAQLAQHRAALFPQILDSFTVDLAGPLNRLQQGLAHVGAGAGVANPNPNLTMLMKGLDGLEDFFQASSQLFKVPADAALRANMAVTKTIDVIGATFAVLLGKKNMDQLNQAAEEAHDAYAVLGGPVNLPELKDRNFQNLTWGERRSLLPQFSPLATMTTSGYPELLPDVLEDLRNKGVELNPQDPVIQSALRAAIRVYEKGALPGVEVEDVTDAFEFAFATRKQRLQGKKKFLDEVSAWTRGGVKAVQNLYITAMRGIFTGPERIPPEIIFDYATGAAAMRGVGFLKQVRQAHHNHFGIRRAMRVLAEAAAEDPLALRRMRDALIEVAPTTDGHARHLQAAVAALDQIGQKQSRLGVWPDAVPDAYFKGFQKEVKPLIRRAYRAMRRVGHDTLDVLMDALHLDATQRRTIQQIGLGRSLGAMVGRLWNNIHVGNRPNPNLSYFARESEDVASITVDSIRRGEFAPIDPNSVLSSDFFLTGKGEWRSEILRFSREYQDATLELQSFWATRAQDQDEFLEQMVKKQAGRMHDAQGEISMRSRLLDLDPEDPMAVEMQDAFEKGRMFRAARERGEQGDFLQRFRLSDLPEEAGVELEDVWYFLRTRYPEETIWHATSNLDESFGTWKAKMKRVFLETTEEAAQSKDRKDLLSRLTQEFLDYDPVFELDEDLFPVVNPQGTRVGGAMTRARLNRVRRERRSAVDALKEVGELDEAITGVRTAQAEFDAQAQNLRAQIAGSNEADAKRFADELSLIDEGSGNAAAELTKLQRKRRGRQKTVDAVQERLSNLTVDALGEDLGLLDKKELPEFWEKLLQRARLERGKRGNLIDMNRQVKELELQEIELLRQGRDASGVQKQLTALRRNLNSRGQLVLGEILVRSQDITDGTVRWQAQMLQDMLWKAKSNTAANIHRAGMLMRMAENLTDEGREVFTQALLAARDLGFTAPLRRLRATFPARFAMLGSGDDAVVDFMLRENHNLRGQILGESLMLAPEQIDEWKKFYMPQLYETYAQPRLMGKFGRQIGQEDPTTARLLNTPGMPEFMAQRSPDDWTLTLNIKGKATTTQRFASREAAEDWLIRRYGEPTITDESKEVISGATIFGDQFNLYLPLGPAFFEELPIPPGPGSFVRLTQLSDDISLSNMTTMLDRPGLTYTPEEFASLLKTSESPMVNRLRKDYIELPNEETFGPLAGKMIHRDAFHQLSQFLRGREVLKSVANELNEIWWESRSLGHLLSGAANFISRLSPRLGKSLIVANRIARNMSTIFTNITSDLFWFARSASESYLMTREGRAQMAKAAKFLIFDTLAERRGEIRQVDPVFDALLRHGILDDTLIEVEIPDSVKAPLRDYLFGRWKPAKRMRWLADAMTEGKPSGADALLDMIGATPEKNPVFKATADRIESLKRTIAKTDPKDTKKIARLRAYQLALEESLWEHLPSWTGLMKRGLRHLQGFFLAREKGFAGEIAAFSKTMYGRVNNIHRLGLARYLVENEGWQIEAAIQHVNLFMQTYARVPKGLKDLSTSLIGAPIMSFSYEAIRTSTNLALNRPGSFWAMLFGSSAMHLPGLIASGIDPYAYADTIRADTPDLPLAPALASTMPWWSHRDLGMPPGPPTVGLITNPASPWNMGRPVYGALERVNLETHTMTAMDSARGMVKNFFNRMAFNSPVLNSVISAMTGLDPVTGESVSDGARLIMRNARMWGEIAMPPGAPGSALANRISDHIDRPDRVRTGRYVSLANRILQDLTGVRVRGVQVPIPDGTVRAYASTVGLGQALWFRGLPGVLRKETPYNAMDVLATIFIASAPLDPDFQRHQDPLRSDLLTQMRTAYRHMSDTNPALQRAGIREFRRLLKLYEDLEDTRTKLREPGLSDEQTMKLLSKVISTEGFEQYYSDYPMVRKVGILLSTHAVMGKEFPTMIRAMIDRAILSEGIMGEERLRRPQTVTGLRDSQFMLENYLEVPGNDVALPRLQDLLNFVKMRLNAAEEFLERDRTFDPVMREAEILRRQIEQGAR